MNYTLVNAINRLKKIFDEETKDRNIIDIQDALKYENVKDVYDRIMEMSVADYNDFSSFISLLAIEIINITCNDFKRKDNISNKQKSVLVHIQNTNKEPNTQEETRVLSDAEKLFLEFWAVYPKKVDKKGAFRAFKNIKKLKEVFPEIMSALEIQKRSEQWTKANGQYIPNPTTYIHQERWTTTTEADEIKANLDQMFLENINQFNPWRRKDA